MKNEGKNSVLIVDDEPANIVALRQILSPEYDVYGATDGKTAIMAAKEKTPDLILLDVLMPDMDGYEVLSILKSTEETQEIPVVFVTGLGNEEAEERGLWLGAEDYILKPFSSVIVNLRVRNILKLYNRTKAVKERLRQQALMTKISHSFLTGSSIESLLTDTVRLVGDFMGISKVTLLKYDDDEKVLIRQSEWLDPGTGHKTELGERIELEEVALSIIGNLSASNENYAFLHSRNPAIKNALVPYRNQFQNYIMTPVFAQGKMCAVVDFAKEDEGLDWSESEIDLAVHLASILSSAFERDAMERQFSIVEHASSLALYITPDAVVEYVNPAVISVTGHTKHDLITEGLGLIISDQALFDLKENRIPKALLGEPVQFELNIVRKDGEKRILAVSLVQASKDNLGITTSDLTEIRKLEARLIEAIENAEHNRELAERSSRAKSEFLSRMSHEMLTPMNAIIGMAQIAKTAGNPEKTKSCLEKIDDSASHLQTIIHDVLNVSGGSGSLAVAESQFSVASVFDYAQDKVNCTLKKKEQTLSLDVCKSIPETLIGDEKRIAQVIIHLLSNAMKFSPSNSEISLGARLHSEDNDTITLKIDVADSGIGVSEDQQGGLFDLFEQVDGSNTRKYGGIGIGLPLSKSIVKMMDGDIWVESELGKGSKFTFTCKTKRTA